MKWVMGSIAASAALISAAVWFGPSRYQTVSLGNQVIVRTDTRTGYMTLHLIARDPEREEMERLGVAIYRVYAADEK